MPFKVRALADLTMTWRGVGSPRTFRKHTLVMAEMENRTTAIKKACWGFALVLIWSGSSWLTAKLFFTLTGSTAPLPPSLRVSLQAIQCAELFLFFAGGFYYLGGRRTPFPTLKVIVAHSWIGIWLGFIPAIICLVLSPALYYPATRLTNPPLIAWVWAIVFFLGAAVTEEIIYRGALQHLFELFCRPIFATLLQVALFVSVHRPFPDTPSALAWFILSHGLFGIFVTLLVKKSPYLILPIFFHASKNLFVSLPKGLENNGFPIEGIWNLSVAYNYEYLPFITGIFIVGFWYAYGWDGTGRVKKQM
jgi:membrane protease YdiL (CAAX protease family)